MHRRDLSNMMDALQHTTDTQVNEAKEDPVTLHY